MSDTRDGSRTIIKAQRAIAKTNLTQVYRAFVKSPTVGSQVLLIEKLEAYAQLFSEENNAPVLDSTL
jgi:hypothetical protein